MKFKKLPPNSEKLLLSIVDSSDPEITLCSLFENASSNKDNELRSIVKELQQEGYINVMWADNIPYNVIINNSARTYSKQLMEFEKNISSAKKHMNEEKPVIFISHRSTDKDVADMLVDFFTSSGISRESIFCSSLPGNDVNEKISQEIKLALQNSVVNIAILSYDYYQSAYCLNEAGILWYNNTPVIVIALPEINSNNMIGFLNNEYKLRHLDSETDISYIYDTVHDAISMTKTKMTIITVENQKLRARYENFLKNREQPKQSGEELLTNTVSGLTTDDEKIVLYYILKKQVRKVSKSDILDWLHSDEVYDVNIDNAFDLLSSFDDSSLNGETLELGFKIFRNYSSKSDTIISILQETVDNHIKKAIDVFMSLWNSDSLDDNLKLFLAYIVDERMTSFGDRWKMDKQIENIKDWEDKNALSPSLSENYGSCLQFMIQNHLVYETSWTSYGNPREYSLCHSLQDFLLNCPSEYIEELQGVKDNYHIDLPF